MVAVSVRRREWARYTSRGRYDAYKPLSRHHCVDLSLHERCALLQEARRVALCPYERAETEAFVAECAVVARAFEPRTLRILQQKLEQSGVAFIRGLPDETNLVNTPVMGGGLPLHRRQHHVGEAVLMALGHALKAEPFNFRQEGIGTAPLIDNVVPLRGRAGQKGAGGYHSNFPFHSENAWHRRRPCYVALLGLRNNSDAKTLVFSASQLTNEQIDRTYRPGYSDGFRLQAPELYLQMKEAGIPLGTHEFAYSPPIEIGNDGVRLNINFNGTWFHHLTDEDWLEHLEDHICRNCLGVALEPGTALLLNNAITCHTRTGYQPRFDGTDRWFLRANYSTKLWDRDSFPSASVAEELRRRRWINERGELTGLFGRILADKETYLQADCRTRHLIEQAALLTPLPGERIV